MGSWRPSAKPPDMPATVDAGVFGSLEAAIKFVASRGGGVVRTALADTPFAKSLKLPPNVKLEKIDAEQAD